jgi:hypothetical protein
MLLKDLSLQGFWLQKWMNSDKAEDCRTLIDYLLGLVHEGKFKYEYVKCCLIQLLLDAGHSRSLSYRCKQRSESFETHLQDGG